MIFPEIKKYELQFIESKNLPHDLGNRLQNHFEFQYRKTVENQAGTLVDLPRYNMIEILTDLPLELARVTRYIDKVESDRPNDLFLFVD